MQNAPLRGCFNLPVKEADADDGASLRGRAACVPRPAAEQARALDAALRDVAAQVSVGTNNMQVDDQGRLHVPMLTTGLRVTAGQSYQWHAAPGKAFTCLGTRTCSPAGQGCCYSPHPFG